MGRFRGDRDEEAFQLSWGLVGLGGFGEGEFDGGLLGGFEGGGYHDEDEDHEQYIDERDDDD